MEHFLEGIAPLRHCYINPKTRRVTNTNILFWFKLPKVLTEHFLQGNVPLRHLLKAKPPFMSWWRYAFKEVNDWSQRVHKLEKINNNNKKIICVRLHWYNLWMILNSSQFTSRAGSYFAICFSRLNIFDIFLQLCNVSFAETKNFWTFGP